jgi:hypothetical protein
MTTPQDVRVYLETAARTELFELLDIIEGRLHLPKRQTIFVDQTTDSKLDNAPPAELQRIRKKYFDK